MGFIERHELWTDEQKAAAERALTLIEENDIRTVRVSWGDQHGILRGKTATVADYERAQRNGIDFQTATLIMDTTNNIIVPLFASGGGFGIPEMTGYPDSILVPDPTTFRVLPWAKRTAWVLSDMYFQNGNPVPFSTRQILRQALADLHQEGYHYVGGLEVEFYITKLQDARLTPEESGWPPEPPLVSVIAHGFQYLTENRNDEIDNILQVLSENLVGVGLPLRTMEDEWGPGQCEFTFDPGLGLAAADDMLLFRTATKQVCRRNAYHASFMCRPALANFFSSGWHLHQSLRSVESGENAFTSDEPDHPISELARFFAGGVLGHIDAASVFTTSTINGYKRFKPYSFAPDRASWALENRGAAIRVIGGPGDKAAHLENRVGEPAANPYLYMASQIVSGLDGMRNKTDPGPFDEEPYTADRPLLPASLMDAVAALREDSFFREAFGDPFIDYMLLVKDSEIRRFLEHVTDWEQREYFEVF
ncbi:MAG: glutamine synthetase family protein [Acidimicrobiales bacterium]